MKNNSLQNRRDFLRKQRRKRGESEANARRARSASGARVARHSRFALALRSPRFRLCLRKPNPNCKHVNKPSRISLLLWLTNTVYPLLIWLWRIIACRTGVIFCVNRGESEASAKREWRARGGALLPSRSPRFRLAFASVYAKNHACSAG